MNTLDQPTLLDPLTERERDILRLMADGLTNREIAGELVLELETVRWYTKQIYSKLGVHSRTQASLRARDLGLFQAAPHSPQEGMTGGGQHNLPLYATSFVGREAELNDLTALLADPNVRLITIAGPGGIGKTRLCIEAARAQASHFADGVFFIPLAPLNSVDEIGPAIARGMHLRFMAGREPKEQLLTHLRDKQLLLVLDNCEHLLAAPLSPPEGKMKGGAELVADILAAAPPVKILATSRSSLNLGAEWVRYLEGVSFPAHGDVEEVEAYGAVKLFHDRVRRVRGDFSLADNRDCVLEICRLVYGLPLALEMAAAWLKTLSCADVIREIGHNIDFLATKQGDVDERHRSIRVVFDYSWRLLSDEERRVFRRLSVFRGEFGRAAAEQVAGASLQTLSELIDKSFLAQNSAGLYEIHNLLRRYAEEQLGRNMAAGTLSRRGGMLLAWSLLIKGDFEKVENLAEGILKAALASRDPAEEAFGLALLGLLAGIDEDYSQCMQLCEAGASLILKPPTVENPITAILAHLGLAVAYCGLEDYQAVKQSILTALKLTTTLRSPAFITLCLPVAAIVLAHEVKAERSIELLALAFTHPASTPTWMERWPLLTRLRADLEAELGPPAYRATWEEGQKLDLETVAADLPDELRT